MNTAIYGAGSIGTVLGAYLTKGGLNVDLITRNTGHISNLKASGAHITGTVEMKVPVMALLPGEITKKYDLIFLVTKTTDNNNTIKDCAALLTPDGVICTLQNGMPEMAVAEVIGEERTYGCAIAWGATMKGNGVCELTSEPDSLSFSLGSFSRNPDTHRLEIIKDILSLMGKVEIEQNFIGARWSKLLINSSFSGMSAVLGCTFGEAAENRESRRCIQQIIKECIDVSRKAGIRMEPVQGKDICKLLDYNTGIKRFLSFMIIPLAIRKHRLLKASMLQDLEKGRLCEVDGINGVICSYGEKYNHPTPFNDMVVKVIHEIEEGRAKPGFENLVRFRKPDKVSK